MDYRSSLPTQRDAAEREESPSTVVEDITLQLSSISINNSEQEINSSTNPDNAPSSPIRECPSPTMSTEITKVTKERTPREALKVIYGNTFDRPQYPSLVISGGCCQTCKGLLRNILVYPQRSMPLHNWKHYIELEVSDPRTCNVCNIIRQTIVYSFPDLVELEKLNPDFFGRTRYPEAAEGGTSTVKLEPTGIFLDFQDPKYPKSREPMLLDLSAKPRKIKPFVEDGKSKLDSIASQVNDWHTTCKILHPMCEIKRKNKRSLLPKRVIMARLPEEGGPFLYTPEKGQTGRYLALSYCWGKGGHGARTTASNLASMHKSIPWEILPKTIQDAIILTRQFVCIYLWVDGLCIIQADNPGDYSPDWDAEAVKVGEYYRNAEITLAAASAADSSQGCFIEDSIETPENHVDIEVSDGDIQIKGYLYPSLPTWKSWVLDSPLLKRGWVMQERHSSERVVYLTKDCVFWECLELHASTFLPGGITLTDEEKNYTIESLTPPAWYSVQGDPIPDRTNSGYIDRLFYSWYFLVSQFSKLSFTYIEDRLPAISSLAMKFCGSAEPAMGKSLTYTAGLLADFFPRGLGWYTLTSPNLAEASPSWSWVSVDRAVSFLEFDEFPEKVRWGTKRADLWKFHIQGIAIDVDPVNESYGGEFGRILRGRLDLRVLLCQIHLHQYFPPPSHYHTTESPASLITGDKQFRSRIAWDIAETDENFAGRSYTCLLLCSGGQKLVMLILSPCSETPSSTPPQFKAFRRLGMVLVEQTDSIGPFCTIPFWSSDRFVEQALISLF